MKIYLLHIGNPFHGAFNGISADEKTTCLSENENFDFSLIDQSGNEYEQIKSTGSGEYYFIAPNDINEKLYLKLTLVSYNQKGVECKRTVLGKYPYQR